MNLGGFKLWFVTGVLGGGGQSLFSQGQPKNARVGSALVDLLISMFRMSLSTVGANEDGIMGLLMPCLDSLFTNCQP